MASGRFARFILPKETAQKPDKDAKTNKMAKISETTNYLISTHTFQENPTDILISEDLVQDEIVDHKYFYLEVILIDQAAKFVIMVTKDNVQANKDKTVAQISIQRSLVNFYRVDFDLNNRFTAQLRILHEQRQHKLSQVEVVIKDYFFSRRDLMQVNQKLLNQTCYTNKVFSFGAARVKITNLIGWQASNLDYTHSGIITNETVMIFRSLEAKYAILIEVSQQTFMNGAVEEVCLESYCKFIKIFQLRNQIFQSNHKFEVILFARVYYPELKTADDKAGLALQYDSSGKLCQDFYKKIPLKKSVTLSSILVSEVISFLYWINCQSCNPYFEHLMSQYAGHNGSRIPIKGVLSKSQNSNLLEAITLVVQHFGQDYATRSLTNSGHSILILSPGNGYYFGSAQNYKITKRNLIKNNIVCYLNAFGRIPDISGPLFQLLDDEVSQDVQEKGRASKRDCGTQIKHAYWIWMIKHNDELLRSVFLLYDKMLNPNEYFLLCLKKFKNISYSQIDFTLLEYAQKKEQLSQAPELEGVVAQAVKNFIQSGQERFNIQDELNRLQLRDQQVNELEDQNQVKTLKRSQIPNIFEQRHYIKQEQVPQEQTVQKQIAPTKKTKMLTHNRMRWNLFYLDSKIHGLNFSMNPHYHKIFRNYLVNVKENDPNYQLFQMEAVWKNLVFVPLVPLKVNMFYVDVTNQKSQAMRSLDCPYTLEQFQQQTKGIILSDNYQLVEGEKPTDQYQQDLRMPKDLSSVQYFIKDDAMVKITYVSSEKKYTCEIINRKQEKQDDKRYVQGVKYRHYRPIKYSYLLYGEDTTKVDITFNDYQDNDIMQLLQRFDSKNDYNASDIQMTRPKSISYVLIPTQALQPETLQQQYAKFKENFDQFLLNLKNEIPNLEGRFNLTIVPKKSQLTRSDFNEFNLKYGKDLPDYRPYLHPDCFEQVCFAYQLIWCPKCVFHIKLSWISSGTLPLMLLQQILKSSATNASFTLIQIPRFVCCYFTQQLPFENLQRLRCKTLEKLKAVKKKLKFAPFECYPDNISGYYIHRKGYFFLMVDNENYVISWKDNVLQSEQNSEAIAEIYRKMKELVDDD